MLAEIAVALAPSMLLIGLGAGLRRGGFLSEGFWSQAERLTYFILLPALLVQILANAPLNTLPVAGLGGVTLATTLVGTGALLALHRHLAADGPAFSSVLQGTIRFNNYVALSVIPMLEGAAGLGLAAVVTAVIVPTVNIICVLVLGRFGQAGHRSGWALVGAVIRNPLLLAAGLGVVLNFTGIGLHAIVESSLKTLSAASIPLGLLCVGAALRLDGGFTKPRPVLAALIGRFAVMPLLVAGLCLVVGVEGASARVAVLMQALPTATSSYILARQLGGDAPLMAVITTAEHIVAVATLVPTILLVVWLFP